MNKNAVIVGATGGIGSEITKSLMLQGYHVSVFGRSYKKTMQKLKDSNKDQWDFYEMDFEKLESIKPNYDLFRRKCNKIDVFINCAGVGIFGSIENITYKELIKVFNVNTLGPILLLREVVVDMKRARNGLIINIESIASVKAFSHGAMYISSKHALAGFSESLWAELKQDEIQVCSIRPGLVNTSFVDNVSSNHKLENALLSKDIAHVVEMVVQQSSHSNISSIEIRPLKKSAQNLFHCIIDNKEN